MQAGDSRLALGPRPFETALARLLRVRIGGPDTRHRPVFCPAPGLAGLETQMPSSFPLKGRAERQGVSPRPRRHVGEHVAPCAEAHGKQQASDAAHTPAFRTQMDFAACSMSQEASQRRRCPVRASCCPDMHLGRPPAWSASTACRLTDPRLPPVIRKPSGPTSQRPPHPAPHYEDAHDAPLIGTGRMYLYFG